MTTRVRQKVNTDTEHTYKFAWFEEFYFVAEIASFEGNPYVKVEYVYKRYPPLLTSTHIDFVHVLGFIFVQRQLHSEIQ